MFKIVKCDGCKNDCTTNLEETSVSLVYTKGKFCECCRESQYIKIYKNFCNEKCFELFVRKEFLANASGGGGD